MNFPQRTPGFLSSIPPCVKFLSALTTSGPFSKNWWTNQHNHQHQIKASKTRQFRSSLQSNPKDIDTNSKTISKPEIFQWRGHEISFLVTGPPDGKPVLLTHGFGANSGHWRKNIPVLNNTNNLRIYAIDLLGFGASDKPNLGRGNYSLELWRDLVVDFIQAMDCIQEWALVGNSIGSLISLMAVTKLGQERIRGLVMLNCAGGLTSFRYSELNPLLATIVWCFNILLFNRYTGPSFFNRFRTRENIRSILAQQVYYNKDQVDDELVDILHTPALDENAAQVFLSIVTGPPGPSPEELLPQIPWCKILVLWGENDPWTPLERGLHPGSKFEEFHPQLKLVPLPETGHCPHDDSPERVHEYLLPFLIGSDRIGQ